MWPMRTPEECKEVCEVFNLPQVIVENYIQFGSGEFRPVLCLTLS